MSDFHEKLPLRTDAFGIPIVPRKGRFRQAPEYFAADICRFDLFRTAAAVK
jgi:hypothetical protein